MPTQFLIDSSFLYALYNTKDTYHEATVALMETTMSIPLIPTVILPEVTFLFARDQGHSGVIAFMSAFAATSANLVDITQLDLQRAAQIMARYASAEFDMVDCCLMALAERLKITQICTYDRRDFGIFRPVHCDYFDLLP